MLPTLLAAAGDPDINEKLLNGYKAGNKTFKVHIDGYNMLPYLTGEVKESPRNVFFYFSDDGDIMAVRVGDWKLVFAEQRAHQMEVWAEPFVKLRLPHIFNLRRDPFERASSTRTPTGTGWSITFHSSISFKGWWQDQIGGLRQVPATPETGVVQP